MFRRNYAKGLPMPDINPHLSSNEAIIEKEGKKNFPLFSYTKENPYIDKEWIEYLVERRQNMDLFKTEILAVLPKEDKTDINPNLCPEKSAKKTTNGDEVSEGEKIKFSPPRNYDPFQKEFLETKDKLKRINNE